MVAQRLITALERYRDQGTNPGGFLNTALCGDLYGAFDLADSESRSGLVQIVEWIRANLPRESYGSHWKVMWWIIQKKRVEKAKKAKKVRKQK